MVNMDETLRDLAIDLAKIESADETKGSVMGNAPAARGRVAL